MLAWDRAADGTLTPAGTYPTGGLGSGTRLGSQGALVLSQNGRWLFAVDAGSNEITSFRIRREGPVLVSHVASSGLQPISLTISDDLLYVLNAGGAGNISGFRIDDGALAPIANSTRALSGSAIGPAQVSFSPDGDLLVVTEKTTNQIVTYTVGRNGRANEPNVFPSSGAMPFGFAFAKRGTMIVSEANGAPGGSAASSYNLGDRGNLDLVSASIPTGPGAACWVVVTRNRRYAYTANATSGSISSFSIGRRGELTLLNADGRTGVTGDSSGPNDLALNRNNQFLYVRNARNNTISAFTVAEDGSLQPLPGVMGA